MTTPPVRDAGFAGPNQPFGLVLAGGRARRMGGGDKPLLTVGHKSMAAWVLERIAPQCCATALNAQDPTMWAGLGVPVLPDIVEGQKGPLAGVLTGLAHIEQTGRAQWLLTVPGDTPFVPRDLVAGLVRACQGDTSVVSYAASGGRPHPTVGLWPMRLRPVLEQALVDGDVRGVMAFLSRVPSVRAEWAIGAFDPFFNVNTPDDLVTARQHLRRTPLFEP